jgi:hypothetical protein
MNRLGDTTSQAAAKLSHAWGYLEQPVRMRLLREHNPSVVHRHDQFGTKCQHAPTGLEDCEGCGRNMLMTRHIFLVACI